MRARILAGAGGWLAGVLPLVAVHAANYAGQLTYDQDILAGVVAFVGGIVLGGVVAGGIGARRGRGVGGAAGAGGIAGGLYAVTLAALLFGSGYFESTSGLISQNPLGVCVAILFCASLLLGIAVVVGLVVGRVGRPVAQPPQAAPAARQPYARPSGPSRPLPPEQWAPPGRPAPVPARAYGRGEDEWDTGSARGGYDEGAAYGAPRRDPSYTGAGRPQSGPRRSGPTRRG